MKTYTWEYKEIPNKFDGWQIEVVRTLYTVILKSLNDLLQENPGLSDINYAIECDAATIVLLQMLPEFIIDENVDYTTNTQIIGKLGSFNVVRNIKQIENSILVKLCGIKDVYAKCNYIYMAKIDVKGLKKLSS